MRRDLVLSEHVVTAPTSVVGSSGETLDRVTRVAAVAHTETLYTV